MSAPQPPRLASWLLHHLASSPRPESLAGDLIEQYRHGHSATWYWRQVLAAILAGVTRDIRAHKLLAIRAVAIGWLLYILFSFPVAWLTGATGLLIREWLAPGGRYTVWGLWFSGHLPGALFAYVACLISGWIVARLHQTHAIAMVSLYGASVALFEYGMAGWMAARHGLPPMPQPQAPLILPLLLTIGRPMSIVLGGLWALRSDGNTTRPVSHRSVDGL
jgi:hypothetical protein